MRFIKRSVGICLLTMLLLMMTLSGCTNSASKPITLSLANAGWDSIAVQNAIVTYIAEKSYGITCKESPGSTPICYQAVINGDIDINIETWSGNIPGYHEDLAKGSFLELGINFDDNRQGLYVPRYVIEGDPARGISPSAPDLKNVADLPKYKHVFADEDNPDLGRVYGSIPGWAIDSVMKAKHELYLKDTYNYFSPGSDAALSAVFTSALDKGLPIVGYYWEPTWLIGKYDMVLLEDEPYEEEGFRLGKTACPAVTITVTSHPSLPSKAPEFTEFLKKYSTSSELISKTLAYMRDNKADYKTTAIWFMKNNQDLLQTWLDTEHYDLLKAALENE